MKRALLVVALGLLACGRKKPAEARHEAAPLSSAALAANTDALKTELTRTRERAQAKPDLGCQALLTEAADREMCSAANAAVEQASHVSETTPAPEATHAVGEAALALDRLLERVRFLGFGDLMHRRVERDGGAPAASVAPRQSAAPSAPAASPAGPSSATRRASPQAVGQDRKLMLEQSPLLLEAQSLSLLERQMLRALGAYLEYGTPEQRDIAIAEARHLLDAHSKFRALGFELRQASVLESDPTRKATLDALVQRVEPPQHVTPPQPPH